MSRMKRLPLAISMALGLALSLVLSGCGSTSAANAQKPSVTIGYENAADPEMIAIEKNYFQQYMHANVHLKYYSSGPAALDSLASGALQFMTVLGNPPVATAIAKGVPLQVVWAQEQYTTGEGLVVRPNITKLSQLEGQKVALVTGSTSPFVLTALMHQDGIAPSSITFENMTPSEMVSAWTTKRINAAYVWSPFFNKMVQAGGKALLYDKDAASAAPIFNLAVVNSQWAAKNTSLVDGFIKAEAAGYAYTEANPTGAYALMGKANQITAANAQSQAAGLRFVSLSGQLDPSGGLGSGSSVASSLVTKSLTSAAQYLYSEKAISSVPKDMAQYVNPTFVQQVVNSGFTG